MDLEFTTKLQEWLNTPSDKRDNGEGALLLLKLNHNQIMYRNLVININSKKTGDILEYQLTKWLNLRLQNQTHAVVEEMAASVEKIAVKEKLTIPPDNTEGFTKGKRADHDSLPAEIQACYVENLPILQRMREVHLRLRLMSEDQGDGKICKDSDRYPYLKEIIELHKQYLENWKMYDTYTGTDGEALALAEEKKAAGIDDENDLKVTRVINLQKGKYKKNPTPELKEKILALFSELKNPSEKMVAELKELGIIE